MKRILLFFIFLIIHNVSAQKELVFVYFKDKPNKANFYSNPSLELSPKSLERRTKFGIKLKDEDAPIELNYIETIENMGFPIEGKSKWMNGIAIEMEPQNFKTITDLSFISHIETFVKNPSSTAGRKIEKFAKESSKRVSEFNYGKTLDQINQINLRPLHTLGYTGKNITIAVLDTEFPTVNTGSTFAKIRTNQQIKGTYNFTTKQTDVYNNAKSSHGTQCFGIIAGYVENEFVGSAPDANFYLYTTENASVEIPQEELYWIEAAEEADRVGVDIISTSLGYRDFDDPRYNYVYNDMDGETTFIARSSKIATEKGIIVVASAGNEGNSTAYKYILSPADQPKVFSIGSVDVNGAISSFSSFGPNANQHPKPDVAARGSSTYYTNNNSISSGNGTSFAAPLAAGGIASLLEAIPTTQPQDILQQLRISASIYPNYNEQIGYGILNFYATLETLKIKENTKGSIVKIHTNPIHQSFSIQSNTMVEKIEIYDMLGRFIKQVNAQNSYDISELSVGNYLLKIQTSNGIVVEKIIKK